MGYMTKKEVAELLNVPLSYLKKMGIIKQYHSAAVYEFIHEHNLPIGENRRVIGVGDYEYDGAEWYQTLEECLIAYDKSVEILILEEENEVVFNTIGMQTLIFTLSGGEHCHRVFVDMEKLIGEIHKRHSR